QVLEKMPVAILTAAGWPRIEHEFLAPLAESAHIERFFVFPNSSAECYSHANGAWEKLYDMGLSPTERERIKNAIVEAAEETQVRDPRFEPLVIDREAQIAYAVIGLEASLEDKKAWDPDQSKRRRLKEAIERRIPDVEVRIGGMTTIDITKK